MQWGKFERRNSPQVKFERTVESKILLKFILMEYVFPLKKYLFLPLARHRGIIIISSWNSWYYYYFFISCHFSEVKMNFPSKDFGLLWKWQYALLQYFNVPVHAN